MNQSGRSLGAGRNRSLLLFFARLLLRLEKKGLLEAVEIEMG